MNHKPCLTCGTPMEGRITNICPVCGRYMAAYTPLQVVTLFAVATVVGLAVCIGLVVLLWKFA